MKQKSPEVWKKELRSAHWRYIRALVATLVLGSGTLTAILLEVWWVAGLTLVPLLAMLPVLMKRSTTWNVYRWDDRISKGPTRVIQGPTFLVATENGRVVSLERVDNGD